MIVPGVDEVTEEQDEDGDDPYGLYGGDGEGNGSSADRLYDQAMAIPAGVYAPAALCADRWRGDGSQRKATTSYIQRRLENPRLRGDLQPWPARILACRSGASA